MLLLSLALLLPLGAALRPRALNISYSDLLEYTNTGNTNVALKIHTKNTAARNATAPHLYGLMFEDISHSGDGGIYAELLRNRAFQGSDGNTGPNLDGWTPIGGAKLSLDRLHPISDALPVNLQVDVPQGARGEVGFQNTGWWGIDVRRQTYTASFYVLANEPKQKGRAASLRASIRSKTGTQFGSAAVAKRVWPTAEWTRVELPITVTQKASNENNTFVVTFDGAETAGMTLYFQLISLFPETYKGRKNGLRKDLAEAFADLKPSFLRFPGGNNLEGESVQTRWRWWKTIGPLTERPGRWANWGYYNTDGLGLLEYLEWCADMSIEPVLAIWAGFSLDRYGSSGTSIHPNAMEPVVQEALDELEYCMGGPETKYGALRAAHGHPAPFRINYVEIGNEDWFSRSYGYRFRALYTGLKARYPNITYVSTQWDEVGGVKMELPPGAMWDTHHYEEPHYFLKNFDFYDNWQLRTGNKGVGVLLGEYSVYQSDTPSGAVNFQNPPDKHVFYPQMLSAIAEGVYALGGERNPHTVKMSSYAPSLQNLNRYNWTPNMIQFTAHHDRTVLSTSYWQQWMFARYRGTHTLPVTNTGGLNPLYWAAAIDERAKVVYLKVINAGKDVANLAVDIDTPYSAVNGTILSAEDAKAFNFVDHQTSVVPRPLSLPAQKSSTGNFNWKVPAFSITVLQFNL
ncbi:glycoside hydrolase [Trichodelitschia bisporula]|uniref:non-reducing end alpha-L-arabinofuranosidase n=1 Tax=Trichodelitschia bisporula TaxID=703511 RepID=A0A6G1HKQ0_9PEZI|nr:glycoside hydrolase [Trichodelitschia bisporula]